MAYQKNIKRTETPVTQERHSTWGDYTEGDIIRHVGRDLKLKFIAFVEPHNGEPYVEAVTIGARRAIRCLRPDSIKKVRR